MHPPGSTTGNEIHQVDHVEQDAALRALLPDWDRLAQADPAAGLFLSPRWLHPVLSDRPGRWVILAARGPQGALTGLLPLWRMRFRHRTTGAIRTELQAAGRMAWSEYCGFLCAPGREPQVAGAFAQSLARMDWAHLSLPYLPPAQADRAAELAAALASVLDPADFHATWPDKRINDGAIDSHLCPRIDLPSDFDSYLAGLGANTRQKLRRLARRHLDSGELTIRAATETGFAEDLAFALDHWARRWTPAPGQVDRYATLFRGAMARGQLAMPVLLRGDRRLGALLILRDPATRYQLFKLAARDHEHADLPVGTLLHSHAIRTAIAEGYETYDFGHGNERYKHGLGARDLVTRSLSIHRTRR